MLALLTRTKPQRAVNPAPARRLAAAVGPDCVEVTPRWLRLGQGYTATFAATGYPAVLGAPWLETILSWPGRLDVAIHIDPIRADTAAKQLSRQRAKLESSRRIDADKGRLGDPGTDAAAEDAAELADRIARGASKLYDTGVYITVHAATTDALVEACAQVRAAAGSVLLDLQPVTHRHLQGWTTTLPLGTDAIRMRRTLDTQALAAAFPLASPDLPAPLPGDPPPANAVLYGVNLASAGVVMWDRWAQDNHNSVVLARSGSGKSYLVKLEVLRNLYQGVQVAVVDPEDEYVRLAQRVGGTVVQLGAPGVRLNPLDIPAGDREPGALHRRALFMHTVIAVLAGAGNGLPPEEVAVLDSAILDTYHRAGITEDPATLDSPAPLLRDLQATLQQTRRPGRENPGRPARPVGHRQLQGPVLRAHDIAPGRPPGRLVVAAPVRRGQDHRHPPGAGQHLAQHRPPRPAATAAPDPGRRLRRLVVVDEAWMMLRDGAAANWLFKMAKAARKRNAGHRGHHPGRRRRPRLRSGAGGHRQQRHPDPDAPSPAGD